MFSRMNASDYPHLWRLGLHVVQAGKHFLQCKAKFSHLTDICYGNMEIWQSYQMGIILLNIVKPCEAMRSQSLLDSMINWKILTQGENRTDCLLLFLLLCRAWQFAGIPAGRRCKGMMPASVSQPRFPGTFFQSDCILQRNFPTSSPSHPPPQFCTLYPLCYRP